MKVIQKKFEPSYSVNVKDLEQKLKVYDKNGRVVQTKLPPLLVKVSV